MGFADGEQSDIVVDIARGGAAKAAYFVNGPVDALIIDSSVPGCDLQAGAAREAGGLDGDVGLGLGDWNDSGGWVWVWGWSGDGESWKGEEEGEEEQGC